MESSTEWASGTRSSSTPSPGLLCLTTYRGIGFEGLARSGLQDLSSVDARHALVAPAPGVLAAGTLRNPSGRMPQKGEETDYRRLARRARSACRLAFWVGL
jgi:hypothetical protein